ncbi:hypothetical protein [Shewanella phaeophyticola]|uniref:N-acetyltransferase domain-containing protein n=1 Tax=Shewanella phaeophyticola TaxID=2978345 RepID=A0ABT2P255_9GAMM|nr:hypothetical protein [Shewanella sp. KJ10-1]MCT8985465.1 hypothetical protein [Shewanella sp. KJ10-1]
MVVKKPPDGGFLFLQIKSKLMIKADWLNTDLLSGSKDCADRLAQIKQWSALKLFYRQHMPYARVSVKESVAVIRQYHAPVLADNKPSSMAQAITTQTLTGSNKALSSPATIIAAVRIKTVGQFQLINGVLVEPDSRGKGIASDLFNFINPHLIDKKCFFIY